MKWEPIETAPMDGTLVLLCWPEGFIPDGYYGSEEWPEKINRCIGKWLDGHRGGNWVVPLIDAYWGVPSDPSCDLDFIEVDPTHWVPLPDPPDA